MKKQLTYILILVGHILFFSCQHNDNRKITYRGISIDDPHGKEGIYNPERGLRLETAVDLIDDRMNPSKELIELSNKYASDSVSLSQSYFYLTHLAGKDLTEEDFSVMQKYFDELQKLGKKSVLRFAYERDFAGRQANGPTLEQALEHLDQLKPFLEKNKDLILVVQAGVIGAWGEWHSSVHGLENSDEAKRAILKKLLEIVPEERAVQVRIPEFKNLLKDSPEEYKRLSFHDDMIIIKPHKWDGDMHEGTPYFDQMVKESPYLPVDGELPWGFWSINSDTDSPDPGWIVDGVEAARRFFLQHFTSLSIIHNYLEERGRVGKENEIKYSMQVWKEISISEEYLKENKMPISANYFEKKDGTKVERNTFDYIRDHLGYRIELQDLEIPTNISSTKMNNIKLSLINRGFSTLFNEHQVYYVLINESGEILEFNTEADPHSWQPYNPEDPNCTPLIHFINKSIDLPNDFKPGKYRLGLWIPDGSDRLKYNHRYSIRCANGDIEWWISPDKRYGINILVKDIEISE